jgi:hypothetical protein
LPGQTLNVDLLFVPASHLADVKLPAVSGSSGHLVVERLKGSGQELDYHIAHILKKLDVKSHKEAVCWVHKYMSDDMGPITG